MKKLSLLFLLTMSILSTYAQNKEPVESKFQAEIKFEDPKHDFGVVREGEVVSWEFKFTNTGDSLLIIKNVASPCGCVIVDSWPKDPIKPGESGVIKISYNSKGRTGAFRKNIPVISNSKNNVEVVEIRGTVERGAAPPPPPNK